MRRSVSLCFIVLAGVFIGTGSQAARLVAPGGGAVRALIMGIDDYPRIGPDARLGGAVSDARDLSAALKKVGVDAPPVPESQITRAWLIAEMDKLVSQSRTGDLVILSFAGHGMQVPEYEPFKGIERKGANEQIILSDYSFSGNGALEVIVNKELLAWASRLDAKGVDVLIIMDSCFGGGMVRAIDPRGGAPTVRAVSAKNTSGADRAKFVPISMTEKEKRTNISSLSHVTFIAGALEDVLVPETVGLDRENPKAARGALSYFVARAIEGVATGEKDVDRSQLYRFVNQNVRQKTEGRQLIDFEPRSEDESVLRRVVFRLDNSVGDAATRPQASANGSETCGPPPANDPVSVAVIGGTPGLIGKADRGLAPLLATDDASKADLVWDYGKDDILAHGDVVMHGIDGSLLGGIIDRTWAIRAIQGMSITCSLPVKLAEGGKLYVRGELPTIVAAGVKDRYLSVFNIAADGRIQLLYPTGGREALVHDDQWTFSVKVDTPYGADQIVVLTTSKPAPEFLKWLTQNDQKMVAARAPSEIARVVSTDPTARVGVAGLYTAAARN